MSEISERARLNCEIALFFGFKRHEEVKCPANPRGRPQWTYPKDWYLSQGGTPNYHLPNFVQIIEDYLALHKKHQFGCPLEWFKEFENG